MKINELVLVIFLFGLAPCQAQESRRHHDGLFPIVQDSRLGYIDQSGKVVIAPRFDLAYAFSEGLAEVVSMDKKFGYIDKDGKVIIKVQYDVGVDYEHPVSGGLARIQVDDQYGYIDKSGKYIWNPTK